MRVRRKELGKKTRQLRTCVLAFQRSVTKPGTFITSDVLTISITRSKIHGVIHNVFDEGYHQNQSNLTDTSRDFIFKMPSVDSINVRSPFKGSI
ncbi:hypothetical protein I79_016959 [Cricetulus griseus]|uniref:Uncharacterized protein n=1 Tax=Cricetulus griseus TaxID=10029 RepID=G3I0S0_CRIGR|nr:hypothetical protein I79_016959 [Cricetulus griseus]